jgi:hypothetical protein
VQLPCGRLANAGDWGVLMDKHKGTFGSYLLALCPETKTLKISNFLRRAAIKELT